MLGLSTNALIRSIKSRAQIPTSQSTFTDDDLIAFINEEQMIGLVPTVLQMKDEYFVFPAEIALQANKFNYPIPDRAIGNKLRDVCLLDANNNPVPMTQTSLDDNYDYAYSNQNAHSNAFYIQGSDVIIANSTLPTSVDTMRMYYYLRPNNLVLDEEVATIVSINRTTGMITFDNIPDGYSTDSLFDLVKIKSPHNILAINVSVSAINTSLKTMTFDVNDIPDNLEIGDTIPLAGETKVPNIPTELHVILAQRVAARVLDAIGDRDGLASANQKLGEMEQKTAILIDNRVEGTPRKVVSRNGLLGRNRFRNF